MRWTRDYFKTLYILYTRNLKNRLSRRKITTYQKFLVIGFPRSGTTLLHTYLNSHPELLSMGEVNLEDLQHKKHIIFPPLGPAIKAAGVKVLLPYEFDKYFCTTLQNFLRKEPAIKVILLKRRDPLKMYLSHQIARQTNQWSNASPIKQQSLEARKITVDIPDLLHFLKTSEENFALYSTLLKESILLEVLYEAISKTPTEVLLKVQSFLKVPPAPLVSLLKKQNPEDTYSLVKNFQELSIALSGTIYSKFLKD